MGVHQKEHIQNDHSSQVEDELVKWNLCDFSSSK